MTSKHTRIPAFVSGTTKDLLDEYADAHGLKKAHLIEETILHHLQALQELPMDVIIPARLAVSSDCGRRVLASVVRPGRPTKAMRKLFGESYVGFGAISARALRSSRRASARTTLAAFILATSHPPPLGPPTRCSRSAAAQRLAAGDRAAGVRRQLHFPVNRLRAAKTLELPRQVVFNSPSARGSPALVAPAE